MITGSQNGLNSKPGFFMTDIPTREPSKIVAGDYVQWKIALSDYPASDGWTLSYVLANSSAQETFDAAASGDDHLVTLAAATTAAWAAGGYRWTAYVTKADERYTVRGWGAEDGTGRIEVVENLAAQSSGYDTRTHAEKTLAALKAMIEGRATTDQATRIVAGEVIGSMPVHRLLEFYDKYKAMVEAEKKADDIKADLGHDGNIFVRFGDA